MNMTSKSDCIGVTCTRLRHFADTFSQWNSCCKIKTLGHMVENKCGYQMHIFVTSLSSQHVSVWRCFCMVQPLRQQFRPKCTNRILQTHHQNPVVPPESGVHPQNPVCTYSVNLVKILFCFGELLTFTFKIKFNSNSKCHYAWFRHQHKYITTRVNT